MDEYLTVDQAAALLHVSCTTVRRWIYQGTLAAHKPPTGRNARVLIAREAIKALLTPTSPSTSPTRAHRQAAVEAVLALHRRFAGRGIDVDALLDAHQQERDHADAYH